MVTVIPSPASNLYETPQDKLTPLLSRSSILQRKGEIDIRHSSMVAVYDNSTTTDEIGYRQEGDSP